MTRQEWLTKQGLITARYEAITLPCGELLPPWTSGLELDYDIDSDENVTLCVSIPQGGAKVLVDPETGVPI
jgi:hypothetical protein